MMAERAAMMKNATTMTIRTMNMAEIPTGKMMMTGTVFTSKKVINIFFIRSLRFHLFALRAKPEGKVE
jgi:hypothetical protein